MPHFIESIENTNFKEKTTKSIPYPLLILECIKYLYSRVTEGFSIVPFTHPCVGMPSSFRSQETMDSQIYTLVHVDQNMMAFRQIFHSY